jgi:hypothetical protein
MIRKRVIIRKRARLLVWEKGRILTNVKWSSRKEVTERRLRVALLKKKREKPRIRIVVEKPEKARNWKQVWSVKLIYDRRGRKGRHDLLTELTVTTVSSERLSESDIASMVKSECNEFVEAMTGASLPYESSAGNFIYNKVIVGLVSKEQTDEPESTKFEVIRYLHNV